MTTTNVLPNGVPTITPFPFATTVTGGTATAVLGDASDATYIDVGSAGISGGMLVDFDTFTLPAGAVLINTTNKFRASNPSGSGGIQVHRYNALTFAQQSLTPSLAAYTNNYAGSNVGFMPSKQQDIDQYQVVVTNTGPVGARISELSVDFTYAMPPTSTVTAPTGALGFTTPTVAWTYAAGSDGGSQWAYQVRIFTAAQYGIGGFDPATSPATWDSGTVASGATSVTAPPLPNGGTYRAYERSAAQTGGVLQFAPWTFTGFTISVATADIASVVATPNNTNADHSILISRNTGTAFWGTIDVQRSDDGGSTWTPVRGATGLAVTGNTATVIDYESQNGVAAMFRARANYVLTGQVITGAFVNSSSTTWASLDLWLKDINNPSRNQILNNLRMPEPVYDRPQGIFRIIGSAFPVIVSDVQQAGVSTITVETYTDASRDALKLLASASMLLMQAPAAIGWGNRYVVPGALAEHRMSQEYASPWLTWELVLTEVALPADTGA